jgi:hypothetical protein
MIWNFQNIIWDPESFSRNLDLLAFLPISIWFLLKVDNKIEDFRVIKGTLRKYILKAI